MKMLVILVICVGADVTMVIHDACGFLIIMCLLCWWSAFIVELIIDIFLWYISVLHVLGRLDACNVLWMFEAKFLEV